MLTTVEAISFKGDWKELVYDFCFIWWLLKEPFCFLTVLDQVYSSSELELIHDRLIISAKQRKDKKN